MLQIKCVVIGDAGVGKTSMLITHTSGAFPDSISTVLDSHTVHGPGAKPTYQLNLWDTSGGEDYERFRPLTYPQTDVFLLCFSVVDKLSFEHVTSYWWPQLQLHAPDVSVIIVGLKADLRDATTQAAAAGHTRAPAEPVTHEAATAVVKSLGAVCYLECSALTQAGLKAVFDETARIGLDHAQGGKAEQQKMKKGCTIL